MAIRHFAITNRESNAFIFASDREQYITVESTTTTMASLQAVANILDKIVKDVKADEEYTTLNIILIPKTLSLLLKRDEAKKIKANGYKTLKNNKPLTKEFVDLMIYINNLRDWLTTSTVRFKIQGSEILYPNEREFIQVAWEQTNIARPKAKYVPQPVVRETPAPRKPKNVVINAIEVDDLF